MASKWVLTLIYPLFKVGCNPFTNHSLTSWKKPSSRAPPSMVDHWRTHRGKNSTGGHSGLTISDVGESDRSTRDVTDDAPLIIVHGFSFMLWTLYRTFSSPPAIAPNKICQESSVKISNEVLWISKHKSWVVVWINHTFLLVDLSCQDGLLLNIIGSNFREIRRGFSLQMTKPNLRSFGRCFPKPKLPWPPFRIAKPFTGVNGDGVSCVYLLGRRNMLKREMLYRWAMNQKRCWREKDWMGAFTCWNSEDCIPIVFFCNYRSLCHGGPQVQHQHSAFCFESCGNLPVAKPQVEQKKRC